MGRSFLLPLVAQPYELATYVECCLLVPRTEDSEGVYYIYKADVILSTIL